MRLTSILTAAALSVSALAAPALAAHHHGDQPNIVEIAAGDERFETLVAAVTAADLAGALSGEGPFTVFAPTDDAFATLPAGTVEGLLEEEGLGTLTSILTYHVVSGEYFAAETPAGTYELPTLQGGTLNVVVDSHGAVTVNGLNVIIADIDASNGVIHAIDGVLLP